MSRPLSATVCGKIRYAINGLFKKLRKILISACRKHVVARQGPPHLRLETISDRSGPCPVCENLRLSLPFPAKTCPGEVGGINCGGDMGVRRCLARSLTSLASRCALQRVQTVPAAIHSGRISPPRPTSPRGRKTQPAPLTTPDMVRSGRVLLTSVKSTDKC